MNKQSLVLIAAVVLLALPSLGAAEWRMSNDPNPVAGREECGRVLLAGDGANPTSWRGAWGITFAKNASGGLVAQKSIGEEAFLQLSYQFPYPVRSFQLTTPLLAGTDFQNGGVVMEYSTGASQEFQPIFSCDKGYSGYKVGGSIAPVTSDRVEVPAAKRHSVLNLRIRLKGYVGTVDFSQGAALEYDLEMDRAGKVALRLYPDCRKAGSIYRVGESFRFLCSSAQVTEVSIRDVARNRIVGAAELSPMGECWWGDLPDLQCGIYELIFKYPGEEDYCYRFVLVPSPRRLNLAAKRRSPFGIVGISRRSGFRDFQPMDGPAVAQLMGIHQERSGVLGCWAEVNALREEFKFPMSATQAAELMASTGILHRYNLAWTPNWAVDHQRIKADGYNGWTGHYPPKEEHLADYREFCRRMAAHYQGVAVPEFEIWNEPNNEPHGSFKGSLDEFAALCRNAAEAVHEVLPEARLILGTTGDADVGFVARLLKRGLGEHFGLVDVHPYRHTSQGPEDGLLGDINRLKRAIHLYGKNQGIIFTEVGWPTTRISTGSYGNVTEWQQACFNSRTLLISIAAGVERVHFHMMEDWGKDPDNPEHHFGFFKVDGTPKIAVAAMAGITQHLEGASFVGRLATPEFTHAWYWNTPWEKDMRLVTIWTDTQPCPNPKPVVLPGKVLKAYDFLGGAPQAGRVVIQGNNTVVKPGADPLYLYLPVESTPRQLLPLPIDLRPWLKKRAEAPIAALEQLPDFKKLRYELRMGEEVKAMGFAGVEGENARKAAAVEHKGSAFDVHYNPEGIRFSFRVALERPWRNDRQGWWLWAGDCMRIYLGKGGAGFMTAEDYQLCFGPTSADGKPALNIISFDNAGGYRGAGAELPAEFYTRKEADAWHLSVAFRWKDLGITPKKGDVWGLDIGGSGGYWNNSGSDCWTNPGRWGEIVFL